LLIASIVLVVPSLASAQDWPTRPVRIVSPFAAGGTADILARMVADHLSSVFKQQFFVENRTGAGGAIGVQGVATSPPDGYNLVITNISMLVTVPVMNPLAIIDPRSHQHRLCRRRTGGDRRQWTSGIKSLDQLVALQKRESHGLLVLRHRHQRSPVGHVVRKLAKIDVVHIP
jgi:hypothetical protein